jgi:hypothetical protein
MRAAVDFNDELCDQAGEIGDIGADGMLLAEAVSGDLIATQPGPEDCFGTGELAAKGFCELTRWKSFGGHFPLHLAALGAPPARGG